MKPTDRRHRPDPQRPDAVRSFSTLFSPPAASPTGATNGNGSGSLSDVVSHSVDLGYRIVDDYIRQGEKAARQFTERSATPQTMATDAQDFAVRFAQHASGLAGVWLEFLQLTAASSGMPLNTTLWDAFVPPATTSPPSPVFRPAHAPHNAAARRGETERTSVRIEITASRPTDVVLDLQPSATGRPLSVYALREKDSDTARIADVLFEPESDGAPARLRIRIPADQPPGIYNGLIVDDASGRPVGSVSVSLCAVGDRTAT
jgi:hypothetical protein